MKLNVGEKVLAVVLMMVVLFGGGVLVGRVRPARVIVQTVEQERVVEHTRTVVDQEAVRKAVAEARAQMDQHRVVTEERRPDGTVTRREETDTHTKTEARAETQATESKHADQTADRVVTVTKMVTITPARPRWSFALDGGLNVPTALGQARPWTPPLAGLPRGLEVGASLDRRLLGPVFVGVRASSSGTIGLRVGVTW